jgi:hypothetical protein
MKRSDFKDIVIEFDLREAANGVWFFEMSGDDRFMLINNSSSKQLNVGIDFGLSIKKLDTLCFLVLESLQLSKIFSQEFGTFNKSILDSPFIRVSLITQIIHDDDLLTAFRSAKFDTIKTFISTIRESYIVSQNRIYLQYNYLRNLELKRQLPSGPLRLYIFMNLAGAFIDLSYQPTEFMKNRLLRSIEAYNKSYKVDLSIEGIDRQVELHGFNLLRGTTVP